MTKLSKREAEIAALVARGMANKKVASHLGIADGTVKIHLNRIFLKMGVPNRARLALAIIEQQRSA
jgi:two-component system nitrate/nitrite response regulator NarL